MDFYLGGDLFNFMKTQGEISEDAARFYLTEVVLAIKYLHDKGVLYRDLKVRLLYPSQKT